LEKEKTKENSKIVKNDRNLPNRKSSHARGYILKLKSCKLDVVVGETCELKVKFRNISFEADRVD
jgi:hypothetical protein